MEFSRQGHWSGLRLPPGDLPTQGSNPNFLHWPAGSLPLSHPNRGEGTLTRLKVLRSYRRQSAPIHHKTVFTSTQTKRCSISAVLLLRLVCVCASGSCEAEGKLRETIIDFDLPRTKAVFESGAKVKCNGLQTFISECDRAPTTHTFTPESVF